MALGGQFPCQQKSSSDEHLCCNCSPTKSTVMLEPTNTVTIFGLVSEPDPRSTLHQPGLRGASKTKRQGTSANSVDLLQALRARDLVTVRKLSSSGLDVNVPLRGTTALSLAICMGLEDAVKILLKHGANVNQMSRDHLDRFEPPLYTACRLGHGSIARTLLLSDADANKPDWYGQSPLWAAAREKRIDIVRLLLDNNASIGHINNWSECPLFLATKYLRFGRRDIALLLAYSGCNPDLMDGRGRTALYWSIKWADKEIATLLILSGAQQRLRWFLEDLAPANCQGLEASYFDWLQQERVNPPSLKRMCRTAIRRHLVDHHHGSVLIWTEYLPLPPSLISYLNMDPP